MPRRKKSPLPKTQPRNRIVDTIYEHLRREILSGDLPQGTALQQAELAERFGVSRIPVRDALHRLARAELANLLPGHTAYVAAVTQQDSMEIRQIRVWLEVPALLLAIRHTDKLDELFEIIKQVEALGSTPTPEACEQMLQLDGKFHHWSLRTAGNSRAARIISGWLDVMYRDRAFNVAYGYEETRTSLLQIGAAIQAGDEKKVAQLMTEHIAGGFASTGWPAGS